MPAIHHRQQTEHRQSTAQKVKDMESLQAYLQRAHAATAAVFDRLRDDQWALSTPCPAWDVRALANHMVGGYRLFVAASSGSDDDADFERDWLGNCPKEAYRTAAAEVLAAWRVPGVLDRPLSISIGVVPGRLGALIHLTEVVVHGIDLAVATTQEEFIDEELAQQLLNTMLELGTMERFRAPEIFGPEKSAPPTAPAHRHLMAFLGRPADC
ncbi:TIGR03086 family protein [Paeniglutamicibacter antarcticus]|uniref:TIGR03086 family protein n=1 Tax=Arthrobacter terrae TaxID=2935737 RepID=A0A931CGR1_9MICC|nr:TIGR03086 family metal-binding protein [Arthrobacter terrae]MBG0738063.1 TIGR03086 family protein [Arthrobacter terrae]